MILQIKVEMLKVPSPKSRADRQRFGTGLGGARYCSAIIAFCFPRLSSRR